MPEEVTEVTSVETIDPGFRMENDVPLGTKVRVVQVESTSYDFPNADKLKLGDILTVYATHEDSWNTLVYLKEFYNMEFNSVHFVEEELYQDFVNAEVVTCPWCKSTDVAMEVNTERKVYKQGRNGYWQANKHDLFGMDEVYFECDSCGNNWSAHGVPKGFKSKISCLLHRDADAIE